MLVNSSMVVRLEQNMERGFAEVRSAMLSLHSAIGKTNSVVEKLSEEVRLMSSAVTGLTATVDRFI